MRSLNSRERALVSVVLTIAMLAGFYFLIYLPKTEERAALDDQLRLKQAELANMQQLAAQRDELEREFAARQERIRTIEAKLPPAREIPALLRQMQAIAIETGVKLTLLRPGPLEAPAGTSPGAGQPAAQPPAGQPAQPQTAPGAAPQVEVPYRLFRLELGFEGTYATVTSFLRRMENFPRFIAMTQLTLSVSEVPKLRLGIIANTFVLPDGP